MLPIRRFSQMIILIAFTSCLPAIAAFQDKSDEPVPAIKTVTVKIKIAKCSMIIVPVTINGSGPYDFALDTGTDSTMLDLKLAADLGLPRIGKKRLLGVQNSEIAYTVHADSISVAGATVPVQSFVVSDQVRNLPVKVRGVLGEDFLQNFDVLIDYRHQVIQLQSGPGSLAQTLSGEHLPLQLSGILRGQPTPRRLIVNGHLREFGERSLSLVLDSGTNYLVLFQQSLGFDSREQEVVGVGAIRTVRLLNIGNYAIPDLTLVVPNSRQEMDADGLVPTSLFHSIFISHQGRFVILNPSLPKGSR